MGQPQQLLNVLHYLFGRNGRAELHHQVTQRINQIDGAGRVVVPGRGRPYLFSQTATAAYQYMQVRVGFPHACILLRDLRGSGHKHALDPVHVLSQGNAQLAGVVQAFAAGFITGTIQQVHNGPDALHVAGGKGRTLELGLTEVLQGVDRGNQCAVVGAAAGFVVCRQAVVPGHGYTQWNEEHGENQQQTFL